MRIRPVVRGRVYQEIVQQITRGIEQGELKFGDRLPPEREMAERFQVSRPVIREALCALEMAGIIEVRHGQGSYVKALPQDISSLTIQIANHAGPWEFLEARMVVESSIAWRASETADDEAIARMADILKRMKESVARDDGNFPQLDVEFHTAIAASTRNAVLADMVAELCQVIRDRLFREMSAKILRVKGGPGKYSSQHEQIFQAIVQRDPSGAYRAMRQHLESVAKDMYEGIPEYDEDRAQ